METMKKLGEPLGLPSFYLRHSSICTCLGDQDTAITSTRPGNQASRGGLLERHDQSDQCLADTLGLTSSHISLIRVFYIG